MTPAAAKARSKDEDTEITLGMGKMLALFFGLVVLCAVFFGLGFSFGRNSIQSATVQAPVQRLPITANPAAKPAGSSPESKLTFYKDVDKKDADSQLTSSDGGEAADSAPAPETQAAAAAVTPGTNSYFVQVAAVSKQEDAEILVEALKKKQYAAFTTGMPADKLFHVQIGPYNDIKEAETMRAKLINDGYNPIVRR